MTTHILAIDQGTTSSRAIVFDAGLHIVAMAQEEFAQHFPASGWVEHEPEDLVQSVLRTGRAALDRAGLTAADVAGIGITNQRETTLVWDRATGTPLHRAIVWQDRRTADTCARLAAEGFAPEVTARSGLLLDPYFSGTKLAWLLDRIPDGRARAARGELAFGTVDTWLIWRLTEGRVHATDATNAARTMLYNINDGVWDQNLCDRLGVPLAMLPDIRDCAADFGVTTAFGGNIPILGVAGDQHAATLGQACFAPGMMKATYGTGCFALLNTGDAPVFSSNRLLTTLAYQLDGRRTYALEGSIFVAGAVVQWLRDGLHMIDNAAQSQVLAAQADPAQQVYIVPAFTGLGAPWWDPEARGAIFGLTRATGPAEFARAALESVAFQTRDLLGAMQADWPGAGAGVLRVDGGMTASDWTMQALSDICGLPVDRPQVRETTALGAAWLAGMRAGVCDGPTGFAGNWALDRRFQPQGDVETRGRRYAGWRDAVRRTLTAT